MDRQAVAAPRRRREVMPLNDAKFYILEAFLVGNLSGLLIAATIVLFSISSIFSTVVDHLSRIKPQEHP